MVIGFTGHRKLDDAQKQIVLARLAKIERIMTGAVTGACTGLDSFVARYFADKHPTMDNLIIVPGVRDHVDPEVLTLKGAMYIHMPHLSSYRMRNERIVEMCEGVEAFWNGDKRSGTYMTINIAKKEKRLRKITPL